MDIDVWQKLVILAAAVIGLPKLWLEIRIAGHTGRKADYALAKEFTDSLGSKLHPLAVELGFRAIYPGCDLSAPEVGHLLSMRRPMHATRLYSRGKSYLNCKDAEQTPRVGFTSSYRSSRKRLFFKSLYLTLYFVLAVVAFVPIVFAKQLFGEEWEVAIAAGLATVVLFGGSAILALRAAGGIYSAERFMELQGQEQCLDQGRRQRTRSIS